MQYVQRSIAAVAVAALFLIILPSVAMPGEDLKTVATGVAQIHGDNIAGARQAATQNALRQALEQEVGMLMDATSILKNDDLMEKIYTNTRGYITRYDIIKEGRERDGRYRVKICATVKAGALRDSLVKLGLIKAMIDYPWVLILPYPKQEISPASQTAETMLIKHFTDTRFDLVDPAKSTELHQEAKKLCKVDTLRNVAARIGLKHNAEIVVLYGLDAGKAEFDGIMENVPVSMRAQAVVTTTAQILTAQEKTVAGIGKTPDLARMDGVRRATDALAQPMMDTIVSWWTDYIANGIPYVITLQTPTRADLQILAFQHAIEEIQGVVSLTERSSGGGVTEMMVKYRGGSADLKRQILTNLIGRDGFQKLHTVESKGRFFVFSVK